MPGRSPSWISAPWLKIDLGQTVSIDRLMLGRDRLAGFDDRDPGQFTIEVALVDWKMLSMRNLPAPEPSSEKRNGPYNELSSSKACEGYVYGNVR